MIKSQCIVIAAILHNSIYETVIMSCVVLLLDLLFFRLMVVRFGLCCGNATEISFHLGC